MKHKKRALFNSIISLVLCLSMFVGTTFAWFTDEVVSGSNIIAAGNLDATMEYATDPSGAWTNAEEGSIFGYEFWEPGYTDMKFIRVGNEGNLAFRYQLHILPAEATPEGEADLAEVIDVYCGVVEDGFVVPTDFSEDMDGLTKIGTLADLLGKEGGAASGILLPEDGVGSDDFTLNPADEAIAKTGSTTLCILLHMQETAGNEYQDQTVGGTFEARLTATQYTWENDSFDNQYDQNAPAEFFPGFQGGFAGAAVESDDEGLTTAEIEMHGGDVSAVIPAGVQVADGMNSLELSVTVKESSEANIQVGENEEMRPLDVHIEGVAQGNTVPMLVTLKGYLTTGINTGALKLYHVENGAPVAMTQVAAPTNHNEFSYDPLTGDVTLALASFSEVAVIADTNNPWDGKTEVAYSGAGTDADPYLIANADQLAYFRTQVDNGNTFEGKVVKLNNNIYLSGQNFDPIGWGYVNASHNRDGADGKVFMGTFDGNNKTIFDLYQSGWDLETNEMDYTYTNCGFGLFAAASGATFKNLTIYGASVTVECVEAGVLVGLSQNSCTYENITISNSKIANYQRPAGGLIGEVSGDGTTTIIGVTIGADVVVGSLWGDFDAPCGGVIGARWDDVGANPQIEMENVKVHCRMDVYSDVTSAYQWYAYRRAGMLIGNTELTANDNKHLAAAPFLTCENVEVCYGDWAAYHYCQFTNQDNAWCNNYPWVRAEAGENCKAYSNPRYGQPVIGSVAVTGDNHNNCTAENHLTELRFNQLYGGGQGVYGQPKHDGVDVVDCRYTITYINDSQVLSIKYVTAEGAVSTENAPAQHLVELWAEENIEGNWKFGGWMNAGSTKLTEIPDTNTEDIVLYPYFNNLYTASFVNQDGTVLAWCFFSSEDASMLEATRTEAESKLPETDTDFTLSYWKARSSDGTINAEYDASAFQNYNKDVTLYPYYAYSGAELIPVDENKDGEIEYYQVGGYGSAGQTTVVTIPASVNGKDVTTINSGAFAGFDNLEDIYIPTTVKSIGADAFVDTSGDYETVQIYYSGTKAEWDAIQKPEATRTGTFWNYEYTAGWDTYIGNGSIIACTDGYYKLWNLEGITNKNYEKNWEWHPHSNGTDCVDNCP